MFANTIIKKGEIVEICPFIEVSQNDPANVYGSLLVEYFFYFGKNKEKAALVLGYGSLYNHSKKPNTKYVINSINKTVKFIAIKNIKKDEEITFDYRNSSNDKSLLWFET